MATELGTELTLADGPSWSVDADHDAFLAGDPEAILRVLAMYRGAELDAMEPQRRDRFVRGFLARVQGLAATLAPDYEE